MGRRNQQGDNLARNGEAISLLNMGDALYLITLSKTMIPVDRVVVELIAVRFFGAVLDRSSVLTILIADLLDFFLILQSSSA